MVRIEGGRRLGVFQTGLPVLEPGAALVRQVPTEQEVVAESVGAVDVDREVEPVFRKPASSSSLVSAASQMSSIVGMDRPSNVDWEPPRRLPQNQT